MTAVESDVDTGRAIYESLVALTENGTLTWRAAGSRRYMASVGHPEDPGNPSSFDFQFERVHRPDNDIVVVKRGGEPTGISIRLDDERLGRAVSARMGQDETLVDALAALRGLQP